MFCALLMSRYQVSVYRTNGPLGFFFRGTILILLKVCISYGRDKSYKSYTR